MPDRTTIGVHPDRRAALQNFKHDNGLNSDDAALATLLETAGVEDDGPQVVEYVTKETHERDLETLRERISALEAEQNGTGTETATDAGATTDVTAKTKPANTQSESNGVGTSNTDLGIDHRDAAVLERLTPGDVVTAANVRELYTSHTDVSDGQTVRDRTKNLVNRDWFETISMGRWRYTGTPRDGATESGGGSR